jgi:hypothetical protein
MGSFVTRTEEKITCNSASARTMPCPELRTDSTQSIHKQAKPVHSLNKRRRSGQVLGPGGIRGRGATDRRADRMLPARWRYRDLPNRGGPGRRKSRPTA